ncbi:MAG: hypothetical protein M3454_01770 [Actinomycetota bacterium]|nr:hypothetical protein [Actinomycetota bacterium]
MAETELAADVERLTALLADICERHLEHRDWARHELRTAIAEVAAFFPSIAPTLGHSPRSPRETRR